MKNTFQNNYINKKQNKNPLKTYRHRYLKPIKSLLYYTSFFMFRIDYFDFIFKYVTRFFIKNFFWLLDGHNSIKNTLVLLHLNL